MNPAEDIAYRAHRAAVQRLQDLTEAMWAEEDGTDVDWTEIGAVGPYDGCDDCVVREVGNVVITELEAGGVIRVLDRDPLDRESNPPVE